MRRNILGLAEDHILLEQLRLLLGNVGSSVITAILLALLLVWSLTNGSNALGLELWCGAVILSKLYAAHDARRLLKADISSCRAQHTVWKLLLLNAIDGAAWGGLAWVALGTTSVTGNILVIAVLAGILGSSMSLLSPILPVFFVFCAFEFAPLAIKLWMLNDPAYNALAGAAILYIATLLGQARNSAIAARTAIELRFKNVDLIERLREETLKAEKANLAKSKFLAAASHDLRQPIHALGLFLDALARSELTDNQRKTLTSACAVSEASAEILNTLLDFSRIEAGAVEPHSRPFHLQPLLNKIENELAPQADAKGLIYRSRETHLAVQSDPALVKLILRNLVSNAIRYTKQGGLLVACRTRGDEVVLEVWDTGIGIDPSQQQAIFREFHQLGSAEPTGAKGSACNSAIPDRTGAKDWGWVWPLWTDWYRNWGSRLSWFPHRITAAFSDCRCPRRMPPWRSTILKPRKSMCANCMHASWFSTTMQLFATACAICCAIGDANAKPSNPLSRHWLRCAPNVPTCSSATTD